MFSSWLCAANVTKPREEFKLCKTGSGQILELYLSLESMKQKFNCFTLILFICSVCHYKIAKDLCNLNYIVSDGTFLRVTYNFICNFKVPNNLPTSQAADSNDCLSFLGGFETQLFVWLDKFQDLTMGLSHISTYVQKN